MEKEQEKGLIYFLYGNLQMALLSTKHLIEISEDEKLRRALLEDMQAFEKFQAAIVKMRGDRQLKGLTEMAQKGTEFAIDMKTFFNKDTAKLCDMLATGYEKGIAGLTENLQNATDESEDVKELAKGYLNYLKQAHERYSGF